MPFGVPAIFNVTPDNFDAAALALFRWQAVHNPVYKQWLQALQITPERVQTVSAIPFLPISFFKSHRVASFTGEPAQVFTSSGTTGDQTSRHLVQRISIYEASFRRGFELFYGDPAQYAIVGLLPAYMERTGSSLIYMVEKLVQWSGNPDSGFYLQANNALAAVLQRREAAGQPTLVIGVTFALLDFAEKHPMQLRHTILMETGGMKGRRKELTKMEVHDELKAAFGIAAVHAEYGMTELLSQAYSAGNGLYNCPAWMRVLLREEDDPFALQEFGRGILNIIDLANVESCAFIATDDIGRITPAGFEVMGRMDNSDVRGCSLLLL